MPTRAERKEQTRTALLWSALESFSETGIDAPSLDDICARAGKTRGAFYVHFDDREGLVVAVVERILAEYLEALSAVAAQSDGLEAAVHAFADLLERAHRGDDEGLGRFAVLGTVHFRVVLEAGARIPAASVVFQRVIAAGVQMLGATFVAGQGAGSLRSDIDPIHTGETLIAVLLGVLVMQQGGVQVEVAPIRDTLLRLVVA